jgi:hypothetical protein
VTGDSDTDIELDDCTVGKYCNAAESKLAYGIEGFALTSDDKRS